MLMNFPTELKDYVVFIENLKNIQNQLEVENEKKYQIEQMHNIYKVIDGNYIQAIDYNQLVFIQIEIQEIQSKTHDGFEYIQSKMNENKVLY